MNLPPSAHRAALRAFATLPHGEERRQLEALHQDLLQRALRPRFTFAMVGDGVWLIGPTGAAEQYVRDLKGLYAAWLAISQPGEPHPTRDHAKPGAKEPDNSIRTNKDNAAAWIKTLPGCKPLGEAIGQGVTVKDGLIYFDAESVEAPIDIITKV